MVFLRLGVEPYLQSRVETALLREREQFTCKYKAVYAALESFKNSSFPFPAGKTYSAGLIGQIHV